MSERPDFIAGARLLVVLAMALAAGCSSSSPGADADDPSTTSTVAAVSTTDDETTTDAPSTTTPSSSTVESVPAPELTSEGRVSVGDTDYRFIFECYAAGAGDVLALGVGVDPVSDESTEAIVQAFLGQPYVAVVIGGTEIIELAVDEPAELFVQDGVIRGSALRFVETEDQTGVGTDLGLGNVRVECDGFAFGLPEAYEVASNTVPS